MDTTITKTATPTLSRRSKWSPVSRDRKVPGENKVPRENRASRETPGALAPSVPVSYTHLDVYKRQTVEFGGLLGSAPVIPVHPFSSAPFIQRGGRIPAPMQSLKN